MPPEASDPRIRFGTDGWRGVIADDFTEANAATCRPGRRHRLGRRGGRPARPLVVGYDTRFNSRPVAHLAAEILAANGWRGAPGRPAGADPRRVLQRHRARGGGWSGRDGESQPGALQRDQAQGRVRRLGGTRSSPARVEAALGRTPPRRLPTAGGGRVETVDLLPDYLARLRSRIALDRRPARPLRIVADALHGATNGLMKELVPAAWGEVAGPARRARPALRRAPSRADPAASRRARRRGARDRCRSRGRDGRGRRPARRRDRRGPLRHAARGPHPPRPSPRRGPRVARRGREGLRDGRAGRSAVRAARTPAPRHAHRIQAHREPHAEP